MQKVLKFLKQKIVDWCLSKQVKTAGEILRESNLVPQEILGPDGNVKFTGAGTSGLFVETPKGWSPIKRTLRTVKYEIYVLRTESHELKCADEHIVMSPDGKQLLVKDLRPGEVIATSTGPEKVTSVTRTGRFEEMCDFELDDDDHVFYTDGILSHNTLTAAMYLLWYGMFTADSTILIASKNQSHALEIAARIRFAYEELPNWLKPGVKYYNRHNIELDNGSRIISEATTEKTGRGLSITKIYLDELAFISPRIQQALWSSLTPTLSTGGSAIISSTPNGDTELFAQLWRGACTAGDGKPGVNGYAPFRVFWNEHPERGEEYWNTMLAQLGELQCRQEVGCEFLSSDALLINSLKLAQLRDTAPLYSDLGFKFWKPEEELGGAGKTYLVSLDPSTGSGSDFSVIEVFEFPSLEQVAEFRSNEINIPLIYAKLKWILTKLTNPVGRGRADVVWTFERNGIGEAIAALYQNDDNQPEFAELYSDTPGRQGVFTSGKTKVLSCLQLKSLVEKTTNGLKINSSILLEELKNFVAKGGSYEAKSGATDDAVMATVGIVRLIKRLSEYDDGAFKLVNEYIDPTETQDPYSDEAMPIIF